MKGIIKKNGIFWIDYRYQGQRRRKKIGPSKKLAEAVMGKIKAEIVEGKYLDVSRRQRVLFKTASEEFLNTYSKVNKKSWGRDELSIRYLNAFLGNKALGEITEKDVQQYKNQRVSVDGMTPATCNRELACLKSILRKMAQQGTLKTPVPPIKLFRENNARVRYLTEAETEQLLSHCEGVLKPVVTLAMNTGMRLSEIIGMKWQDVDFRAENATLPDSKTGKREICLNSVAVFTLMGIPKHPESEYVFPGKNPANHVTPGYISHRFERTVQKAAISNLRFHDLRHHFGSWLIMKGVDLRTVQELLGHKDIKMTLRYAHLSPDHKKRAVEVLARKPESNEELDTIWTLKEKRDTTRSTEVIGN